MYGLLNLGSLLLGLISWGLPVAALSWPALRTDGGRTRRLSALSLVSCAAALLLQVLYTGHLVMTADWTALLDTYRTVIFASVVLVLVTTVLNALLLCRKTARE